MAVNLRGHGIGVSKLDASYAGNQTKVSVNNVHGSRGNVVVQLAHKEDDSIRPIGRGVKVVIGEIEKEPAVKVSIEKPDQLSSSSFPIVNLDMEPKTNIEIEGKE